MEGAEEVEVVEGAEAELPESDKLRLKVDGKSTTGSSKTRHGLTIHRVATLSNLVDLACVLEAEGLGTEHFADLPRAALEVTFVLRHDLTAAISPHTATRSAQWGSAANDKERMQHGTEWVCHVGLGRWRQKEGGRQNSEQDMEDVCSATESKGELGLKHLSATPSRSVLRPATPNPDLM